MTKTVLVLALVLGCALAAQNDITFNTTAWNLAPKVITEDTSSLLFKANRDIVFSIGKSGNLLNLTIFNDTNGNDTDLFRRPFNPKTLALEGSEEALQTNFDAYIMGSFVDTGKWTGVLTKKDDSSTNKTQIHLHKLKDNKENTFTKVLMVTASDTNDKITLYMETIHTTDKEFWLVYGVYNASSFDLMSTWLMNANWETGNLSTPVQVPSGNRTTKSVHNTGKKWFTFKWQDGNDTKVARYYLKNNTFSDVVTVLADSSQTYYSTSIYAAKGYDFLHLTTRSHRNDEFTYTQYTHSVILLQDGLGYMPPMQFKSFDLNTTLNQTSLSDVQILSYKDGFMFMWHQKVDDSNDTFALYEVFDKNIKSVESPIQIYQMTRNETPSMFSWIRTPKKELLGIVRHRHNNGTDTVDERYWAGILIDNMGVFGEILKTAFMFVGVVATAIFAF